VVASARPDTARMLTMAVVRSMVVMMISLNSLLYETGL
jgi:hypothetical protein